MPWAQSTAAASCTSSQGIGVTLLAGIGVLQERIGRLPQAVTHRGEDVLHLVGQEVPRTDEVDQHPRQIVPERVDGHRWVRRVPVDIREHRVAYLRKKLLLQSHTVSSRR